MSTLFLKQVHEVFLLLVLIHCSCVNRRLDGNSLDGPVPSNINNLTNVRDL